MTRRCLDLFAGLGGFSAAFADSDDWEVVTVELEERFDPHIQADVFDLRPSDFGEEFDVVLASPPCTQFSVAASRFGRFDNGDPQTPAAKDSVGLVYHTLGLIHGVSPQYWYLENPRGMLRQVLGPPTGTVHYCQYGFEWQKPTDLWGEHPAGFEYRTCTPGADCHQAAGRGFESGDDTTHIRDPAERSKVPYELSAAILDAVEGRAEQSTLAQLGGEFA